MRIFGQLDVAAALVIVGCGIGVLSINAIALFKRHPQGETYRRWPRWLPHRHDWRVRVGWFSTVKDEHEEHETCMRCRRDRCPTVLPIGQHMAGYPA